MWGHTADEPTMEENAAHVYHSGIILRLNQRSFQASSNRIWLLPINGCSYVLRRLPKNIELALIKRRQWHYTASSKYFSSRWRLFYIYSCNFFCMSPRGISRRLNLICKRFPISGVKAVWIRGRDGWMPRPHSGPTWWNFSFIQSTTKNGCRVLILYIREWIHPSSYLRAYAASSVWMPRGGFLLYQSILYCCIILQLTSVAILEHK
jgi:hypothetical protein